MKIALLLALVAVSTAMEGFSSKQKYIEGEYIIRLNDNTFQAEYQLLKFADALERAYNIEFVKYYDFGRVKMMFVKGDYQNVMQAASLSEVKYIQRNQVHHIQQECVEGSAAGCWGLDRTDQREALTYTNPQNPDAVYVWGPNNGASTVAYVADTGIDIDHDDFGGRAVWGYTAGEIPTDGDGNGHGTHCAGTIGSNSYGLAKGVELVAVKVLRDSGFGSTNGIIDGLNWILADHVTRSGSGMAKSVINMSLGGGADNALDEAVEACIDGGIPTVVAAGNSNANACNSSPSRVPDAVTVGATNVEDGTPRFTNWGECIDIFAPGVDVLSTTPDQDTSVFSGTSMAAPHVVGVVARYQDSLAAAPSPADVSKRTNITHKQ